MVHVIYSWIYLILFQNNFLSFQFWRVGAMHSVQNLNVSYDRNVSGVHRPYIIYTQAEMVFRYYYSHPKALTLTLSQRERE